MRKILLLTLCSLLGFATVQAQIFVENFNGTAGTALPDGWTTNGPWTTGTPSTHNSQYFAVSAALDGRFLGINDDKNNQANSNKSVVTAPVSLVDVESAAVSFYALYLNGVYNGAQESLVLKSSVDHGATWETLAEVESNVREEWEKRTYSINNLVGKDSVLFAFEYSDGGDWLYGAFIDNFEVFEPKAKDAVLSSVSPDFGSLVSYVKVGQTGTISGVVYNDAGSDLKEFTINYQSGSSDVQSYSPDATIAPFSSYEFTHDIPLTIEEARDYPVTVWVSLDGDENVNNDTIGTAGFKYYTKDVTKKPLYEEATGTWCGWCPRGTVNMEVLAEEHPNESSQVAVHNEDPMAVTAYDNLMGTFIQGYPSIVYDRREVDDPGNLVEAHSNQRSYFGFVGLEIGSITENDLDITVPVTITPAVNLEGARVALIVTESNIRGAAGGTWDQVNYYTNNQAGPMGGWETEADKVPNTYYHFVGRSVSPNVQGGQLTLPDTLLADATYTVELTTKLNANWKKDNIQYIVALMNADGVVLNTENTPLPELKPALSDVAGELSVNSIEGVNKMSFYPNPVTSQAFLEIDIKEGAEATISISDMLGQMVYRKAVVMNNGSNKYQINTSALTNGSYFITVHTTKGKSSLLFTKTN